MSRTASHTIVTAIKALIFFLEDTSTGVIERGLSALTNIIIVSETSDKAIVTFSLESTKQKVWEPLV